MNVSSWFIIPILLLFSACGGQDQNQSQTENPAPASYAKVSLDYDGIYEGVLPCADCEGIETRITLTRSGTFLKETTYLGKDDETVYSQSGSYSWDDDGSVVILDLRDAPNRFFVGENTLSQLDMDGNRITGELAQNYMLQKDTSFPELMESTWELVSLHTKSVERLSDFRSVPYLEFDTEEMRISGSAGCNRYFGQFHKDGDKLQFGKIGATKMLCMDAVMSVEDGMMNALQNADTYNQSGNMLTLLDEKGDVVAEFRVRS